MNRTIATTLSLAMMCSAAAFAEDQQKQAQSDQQSNQPSGAAAAPADAQPADAEAQAAAGRDQAQQDPVQMFVKDTYTCNLFEIQAGELAAQRAQDDQVKQFARQMVKDHTEANEQLKQAAQSKQIQLQEQLDPVHQAKLQKLQKIPAQEFGRKYINGQVAGHMMNVLEFRYQSQNLQDQQLKQWATQMTPKLEQHLQHATQIATKMAGGSDAQPASAREPGDATSGQQQERSGQSEGRTGTSDQGATPGESGAGTSGQSGQKSE